MPAYRIVKRMSDRGHEYFVIQKKVLWFWNDADFGDVINHFQTLEEAREFIKIWHTPDEVVEYVEVVTRKEG